MVLIILLVVVGAGQHVCVSLRVLVKVGEPLLKNFVPDLSLFDPVDGLLNAVVGLEVVAFGVGNCMFVFHPQQHLGEKHVGHCRDMSSDVLHQALNCLVGVQQ